MDPIAESASVPLVCAAVSQGHIDSPPSSPQNPIKMSTDSASGLRSRTLILCFDGTASQYDGEVSICYSSQAFLSLYSYVGIEHKRRQVLLTLKEGYHRGTAMLLPGKLLLRSASSLAHSSASPG